MVFSLESGMIPPRMEKAPGMGPCAFGLVSEQMIGHTSLVLCHHRDTFFPSGRLPTLFPCGFLNCLFTLDYEKLKVRRCNIFRLPEEKER
jgi:hypothetical protein